ncbi:DUF362 domain-containing protein [Thermodesulfobacteriota bacterium]
MKKKHKVLTRRDFLRGNVCAALGVTVLGISPAGAAAPSPSVVIVDRDEKVLNTDLVVDSTILRGMVNRTVIQLTGKGTAREAWLSLVSPKDIIGLVTTSHANPTHDELVDAVKASLVAAGIPEKNIRMAQGSPEDAEACTALISMPALKTHRLTGIGTVLKNYIMFSGRPSSYHAEDSAKLGEIWHLPNVKGKTKLILVDALHPLCDKGPQSNPRYKWAYNGLIAGTDPIAVETVCLQVILARRRELRGEPWPISPPPLCVEAADKIYGLGTSRPERIAIKTSGWKDGLLL